MAIQNQMATIEDEAKLMEMLKLKYASVCGTCYAANDNETPKEETLKGFRA